MIQRRSLIGQFLFSMSLSAKLTLAMTFLVLVTATGLSLIWIHRERQQFRTELEDEAATVLTTMTATSRDEFYYRDFDAVATMVKQLQRDDLNGKQRLITIRAYQADGRLIASAVESKVKVFSLEADPWGQKLLATEGIVFQWHTEQLLAGKSVQAGSETIGAISIGLSTATLAAKVNAARHYSFGLAAIASIIGITLARYVSRSIIGPLATLTQATQRIADGDLAQTIEVNSQDELAMLAQAFNYMTQRLQTSIRKLEKQTKELQKAKEAADTANQAKSRFLAHMSHDLRTPLNAVLGFAQHLQEDTKLSPQQHEAVSIINRSGEYLLKLINDILEISKIESDQVSLNEQDVNLNHLLKDLEDMFKLKAEAKGIALRFQQAPELPQWIRLDEGKLGQVLINLLGNAVKFTQVGQIQVQVQRLNSNMMLQDLVDPKQCWLAFDVSDTGPGIAESEMDALFSPFSQTQAGLELSEGIGLGLAISKRLAQLIGGDITVFSRLHHGSTFSVRIPVLPITPPAPLQSPIPVQASVKLRPGQSPHRILIVDDATVNRLVLTKIFTSPSFSVQEAQNGQEAIEEWKSWHPDLVLMDMRMPVMDGYDATHWIKQQTRKTTVIAVTANAFEEERQEALKAGCDDFISKPFRRDEILAKVIHHLNLIEYPATSAKVRH